MKSLNHSELYKDYNLNKDETQKNNAEAKQSQIVNDKGTTGNKSVGGEIWYT